MSNDWTNIDVKNEEHQQLMLKAINHPNDYDVKCDSDKLYQITSIDFFSSFFVLIDNSWKDNCRIRKKAEPQLRDITHDELIERGACRIETTGGVFALDIYTQNQGLSWAKKQFNVSIEYVIKEGFEWIDHNNDRHSFQVSVEGE